MLGIPLCHDHAIECEDGQGLHLVDDASHSLASPAQSFFGVDHEVVVADPRQRPAAYTVGQALEDIAVNPLAAAV